MNWTEAQARAIEVSGGDVVVSAGAGAGKTAVLTARCLHKILAGGSIDRLLVITFTESAAHELRNRIGEELRKYAAGGASGDSAGSGSPLSEGKAEPGRTGGTDAKRQLLLLHRSWISTIHAFCFRLLRENAIACGISPYVRMEDPEESVLREREIAEQMAGELLESSNDVRRFVDLYMDGRLDAFRRSICSLSSLIDSVPEPARWIEDNLHKLRSGWFPEKELAGHLKLEVERLAKRALEGAAYLRSVRPALSRWAGTLEGVAFAFQEGVRSCKNFSSLAAFLSQFKFQRWPAGKVGENEKSLKDEAKKLFDNVKKDFRRNVQAVVSGQSEEQSRASQRTASKAACVLLEAVKVFRDRARRDREARDVVDFSDLEHKALELLEKGRPEVLERCRGYFEEALVDEFQDVNPLQNRLVELVSRGDSGNLFVVGDPKQSIYRFRLAEPAIFAERIGRIREQDSVRFVSLQENFRSRSGLLEVLNAMFSYLMTEKLDGIGFDETGFIKSGRNEPVSDSSFTPPFVEAHIIDPDAGTGEEEEDELEELERTEKEAKLVARLLRNVKGQGFTIGGERRLLRWDDFGVLLRAVKGRMGVYIRAFSEAGIPAQGSSGEDPFETLELRDLMNLLRVLDNPRQDIPLAALMRSPFGGFTVKQLCSVRTQGQKGASFHSLVLDGEGFDSELQRRLYEFREQLNSWRNCLREDPVSEALWKIVSESGYFAYLASLPLASQRKARVLAFFQRARQFSSFERQGLFRFLRFLEDLKERGGELGPAQAGEEARNAVTVGSIHASKGLQWPVVVAGELGRRFSFPDLKGRILVDKELGVSLRCVDSELGVHYPTASYILAKAKKRRELLAEELRLLYVAFTRAEEKLFLVGTGRGESLKRLFRRQGFAGKIPEHALLSSRSPLEWICRALGRLKEGQITFQWEGEGKKETPGNGDRGNGVQNVRGASEPLCTVAFHRGKAVGEELPAVGKEEDATQAGSEETRSAIRLAAESVSEVVLKNYGSYDDTKRRAVVEVTALKTKATPASAKPGSGGRGGLRKQPVPEFLKQAEGIEPQKRGTLVHRFLQHMDLRCVDPEKELDRLAGRGIFAGKEKDYFDFDGLRWFLEGPLGRRMREEAEAVRREVPFLARLGSVESGVLLRGVVDGVLFGNGEMEILDYKTDAIDESRVPERKTEYEVQLLAYSWALQEIWGKRVSKAYLVFLSPRVLVPVPEAEGPPATLKKRLLPLVGSR